jgi:hypothetical protein
MRTMRRPRAERGIPTPASTLMVRASALLLATIIPVSADARVFYVDPSTGANSNNGTSSRTPWQNPPGTRLANDTAYWGTGVWNATGGSGNVTLTNKVACGDTILLKGGSTQTSTKGGAWCIATGGGCAGTGSYYASTCTASNPITIRVATNAEWSGSTGPFTLDARNVNLANSSSFDYSGAIVISRINGVVVKGASPGQRLKITDPAFDDGYNSVGVEVDGNIGGITLQYLEVSGSAGAGVAMGQVQDSVAADLLLHDNRGPAINCGQQVHHDCLRVGWVNIEAYGNAMPSPPGGNPFYCDALYVQGAQQLYILNAFVHDNACNGMNVGAGDHAYPYPARTLIRDSTFSHNGLWNSSSNSKANFQGGGDTFPSEVGAPSRGYCSGGSNDGAACTGNGACAGLTCSVYDAYSVFQRVVTFGALGPGAYVHHGSGFTWWNRLTAFNNNIGGFYAGQLFDDRVAADHVMTNSIVVNRAGQTMLSYNSNSLHKVCRQNCPKAGQPCSSNADCGTCATSTTPACDQYLPLMTVRNSLMRPSLPSGTDSESLTAFHFKCDASCTGGTAGKDCKGDADCSGCAGGCNWDNSGSSFANRGTGASFLNDPSNKIGVAFDPKFASTSATNCANGTDVRACDLRLQAGSPAIDMGTFLMLTSCSPGPTCTGTTVTVKENVASRGLDFNGRNSDPNTFFIPRNGYLGYSGDVIQIDGATCNPAGNPRVVSMTNVAMTLDRTCTWGNGKGVDLPWNGAAPDAGAHEAGAGSPPPPPAAQHLPPMLLSVDPL